MASAVLHTTDLNLILKIATRNSLCEWFALEFLTCGIPQGTILGPLLFILYINYLPNCLSSAVARMYVDDNHLTFACNNIETINDVMNHDLRNINKWLVANKLTLNSSKTDFMLVGSQQSLGTYNTSPNLISQSMVMLLNKENV